MLKREELFALIQSLSKSEKRYFHVFCSQQGGKQRNYLRLFDAIAKQTVYDEDAIKRQFAGELFVKQLHVTKHYLRNLVLKSLRNYHAGATKAAEVRELLHNVELLFQRELFQHCAQELQKAEALARTYEIDIAMAEILEWQRKLSQALAPTDIGAVEAILVRQKGIVQQLATTLQYWQLTIDIGRMFGNSAARKPKTLSLLKSPEHAPTVQAKVLYYHSASQAALQKGKPKRAEKAFEELLAYLETQDAILRENPGLYVSSMNNFVSLLIFRKKHRKALAILHKVRQRYAQWRVNGENRLVLKQIVRSYNIELEIYRDTKDFETHGEMIAHIEQFVERTAAVVPVEYVLSLWFQLGSVFFMQKKHTRALHWINCILDNKCHATRPDLHVHGRMLNLLIHWELRNFFVLRYYVDNAKRYIGKHGQLQQYQHVLLNFLVRVSNMPESQWKEEFKKTYTLLFPPESTPLIKENVLDYIDYKGWLQEHVV